MEENKYSVIISDENYKIEAYLFGYKYDGKDLFIKFDPFAALADLLNTVDYESKTSYIQDNYFFKADYRNHPFFSNQEFQFEIDSNFPHPRDLVLMLTMM